jgi:hypothetical protein
MARTMKQMNAQFQSQYGVAKMNLRTFLTGLILTAGLVMPVPSESPWSRLVQKMAGSESSSDMETQVAQAQPQPAAGQPPHRPVAVEDEYAGDDNEIPEGQMFAALNPESSQSGGITGLAKAGSRGGHSGLELGNESDDDGSMFASDLFKRAEIRKLLGDEPKFIYNPRDKSDPMLMPWVRNAAIFKELSELAEKYIEQDELVQAVEVYNKILKMDDPRYTAEVRQKLGILAKQLDEADLALNLVNNAEIAGAKVDLPHWVLDNTTGIIDAGGLDNVCLVGEHLLKVGDVIPDYPNIIVQSISGDSVVYVLNDTEFTVELKEEL